MALLAMFLVALRFLPPWWCGRGAGDWWRGDAGSQAALGRSVDRWIHQSLAPNHFLTGDETFDGEWLFGTYQMAVLGYAQLAEQHPELRAECLRRMELAEDRILSDQVRKFDRREWKDDPIESLDSPNGHAGYLAYFNLALSAHRRLDAGFKHRALHDRISAALARRLAASRIGLIETYPSQTYPVDNCAAAASLRLHDLADGTNRFQELYGHWLIWWSKECCGICWPGPASWHPSCLPGPATFLGSFWSRACSSSSASSPCGFSPRSSSCGSAPGCGKDVPTDPARMVPGRGGVPRGTAGEDERVAGRGDGDDGGLDCRAIESGQPQLRELATTASTWVKASGQEQELTPISLRNLRESVFNLRIKLRGLRRIPSLPSHHRACG